MTAFSPGPGRGPHGPTHPTPTRPTSPPPAPPPPPPTPPADQLAPLVRIATLLTAALTLADGEQASLPDTEESARARFDSAGFHIERALAEVAVLARTQTPAHRDPMESRSQASTTVATPGEPVKPTPAKGEEPTPGSADTLSRASSESPGSAGPGAGADPQLIQPHWHDLIGPVDFRLPRDVRSGS